MPNPITAIFPLAAPQDTDLSVASENASTSLTASASSNDSTLTVASTAGFNVPCVLALDNELVLAVTAPLSTQFAGVIRGFAGTVASTHTNNTEVDALYTAYHHNVVAAELEAIGGWLFQSSMSGLRNNQNLMAWSEAFERWGTLNGVSIVQTNAQGPDGLTTARVLQDGTTLGFQGLSAAVASPTAGLRYIWSIYAKAYTGGPLVVLGQNIQGDTTRCAWFDLNAGAVLTVGSNAQATIVPVVPGWYRLLVIAPGTSVSSTNMEVGIAATDGVVSYTPTGKQVALWGAMATVGNLGAPLPYVKTQGVIANSTIASVLVSDEGDLL